MRSVLVVDHRVVTLQRESYSVWSLPAGGCLQEWRWEDEANAWLGEGWGDLEWRAGMAIRRTWTDWGPVSSPACAYGRGDAGNWWVAFGDGRVACWGTAEGTGDGEGF